MQSSDSVFKFHLACSCAHHFLLLIPYRNIFPHSNIYEGNLFQETCRQCPSNGLHILIKYLVKWNKSTIRGYVTINVSCTCCGILFFVHQVIFVDSYKLEKFLLRTTVAPLNRGDYSISSTRERGMNDICILF